MERINSHPLVFRQKPPCENSQQLYFFMGMVGKNISPGGSNSSFSYFPT